MVGGEGFEEGGAAGVNRDAAGKPCFSRGSFQFSELGRRREGKSASAAPPCA